MKEPLKAKMDTLQAFCRANDQKVSDGLIMRALVMQTEVGPEFLGLIKRQKDAEKEERRRLRSASSAPFPKTTGKKKNKKGE